MYARPVMLWFVCPLMLYWISRIWLLAHRGLIDDDPLSFAVRDRITWVIAAIGAVVVLVARGA
jgi:4-hydroxybenzoate polyprenyltransferase